MVTERYCPTDKLTSGHGEAKGADLARVFGEARGCLPYRVDYFSLAAGYASGVTDMPTYVTSISFDGMSKSVLDYVGREAGMPRGVSDVELAIDRLSGASNWIKRK